MPHRKQTRRDLLRDYFGFKTTNTKTTIPMIPKKNLTSDKIVTIYGTGTVCLSQVKGERSN
jgi:hypothetical protein